MAAAAYRSRSKIQDEVTREWQDYSSNARDVMFSGIFAPRNSPQWTSDRAQLWNEVERIENRKNSQLAREIQLALPHELTELQQRHSVQDFVRDNFVKKGLIADVAIHRPHGYGDDRNVHAHILVTLRQVDEGGWAKHKQRDGKRDELEVWREQWAKTANRHLERHGHEARIDHRSLEEQGTGLSPQIHLGKTAAALEREGTKSERGDQLREIAAENAAKVHRGLQIAQATEAAQIKEKEEEERRRRERRRDDGGNANNRDVSDAIFQLRKTMATQLDQIVVGQASRPDKSWQQILVEDSRGARSMASSEPAQDRQGPPGGIGAEKPQQAPGAAAKPPEPPRASESAFDKWQREKAARIQDLRDMLPRQDHDQDREREYER